MSAAESKRESFSDVVAPLDLEAQQEMAEWSALMAAASLISAIVTAGSLILLWRTLMSAQETYRETKRQADIAEAALQEANRPWLSVQPSLAGDLRWLDDKKVWRINIDFVMKNYGGSPAINVEVEYDIVLIHKEVETLKAVVAKASSRVAREVLGHQVFPNEKFIWSVDTPISSELLVSFARSFNVEPKDFPAVFSLVGCVVYNSVAGRQNKTTDFMVQFGRTDPARPTWMGVKMGESVPCDRLILTRSFAGGRAT